MKKEEIQSTYSGKFSDIYDLFYAEKTYTDEVNFVQSCLLNFGKKSIQKILELGCGTGTHAFLLEKFGHSIIATDISRDMIQKANEKAKSSNSAVKFACQDMVELDQAEQPFDAIICLFDSICYVTENKKLQKLFTKAHAHLHPEGLLIFEFWNAPAMINHLDPIRIKRLKIGEDDFVKISEAEIDYKHQLYQVRYTLYEMKASGQYHIHTEEHTNRFFQIQEMSLFLSNAGFKPVKWFAGYSEDESISDKTWNVLCVAQSS